MALTGAGRDRLAGLGDELLLITNDPEPYAYLGLPTYSDIFVDHGPLARHEEHAHLVGREIADALPFERLTVEYDFVDTSKPENVAAAIKGNTRLIFTETPANPTLKLTDIAAVSKVAVSHDIPHCVDNTFLTPVLQRPLDLGADLSLYSTTKFVDGHNATVGGAITTRDPELRERLEYVRTTLGTIQTPHNAWLTLQGLKTLPLRLARHVDNACKVARLLESNPLVDEVRRRLQHAADAGQVAAVVKQGINQCPVRMSW